MPASPPAPLVHHHPSEKGSFMPASTPTFIEYPSNSLYMYLDYATISTLLCFHAAYPPHHPPRHLRTWVPPSTALLHLTRCRIHSQLSLIRSVPSADYLARTFRHRDFHHLPPLSPLGQTGSTVYFPLEFFLYRVVYLPLLNVI